MKDFINSFKAYLYERTVSPLLGSFIFYWIICNYKFIVILFDENLTSEKKFLAIENIYKTDYISIYSLNIPINGLILPLLITLIYILLFPFISNFIHKAWVWHQNELKRISNDELATAKEFRELRQQYLQLELSFNKTFSEKDKEITQLKKFLDEKEQINIADKSAHLTEITNKNNELKKLEDKLKGKEIEIDHLINDLDEQRNIVSTLIDGKEEKQIMNNSSSLYPLNTYKELNILEYIGEHPNQNTSDIIKIFEIKRIETELIYDKLLDLNFIEANNFYDNGDKNFRITTHGRNELISIKESIDNEEIPF